MQVSFEGSGFVIVQPSERIQLPAGEPDSILWQYFSMFPDLRAAAGATGRRRLDAVSS